MALNGRKAYTRHSRGRRNKPAKRVYKSTSTRRVRHRKHNYNVGIIAMCAVLALTVAVSLAVALITSGQREAGDAPVTEMPTVTAPVTKDSPYITVTVDNSEVHRGSLILVNYMYPYVFPDEPNNVTVYGNKTSSYKVSSNQIMLNADMLEILNGMLDAFYAETGCRDVLVNSGLRTYEDQKKLYDDRVAQVGPQAAADYVSVPGYSEHHTGIAVDFSTYTDDGKSYPFGSYDPVNRLRDMMPEYGFILRYPEHKADITMIKYEGWHYRYVGTAHALIMNYYEYCLEEYVDKLREFTFDGKYMTLLHDGDVSYMKAGSELKARYAVYFVPASDGEVTEIKIPKDVEYQISGNNVDGFVVTLTGKKAG